MLVASLTSKFQAKTKLKRKLYTGGAGESQQDPVSGLGFLFDVLLKHSKNLCNVLNAFLINVFTTTVQFLIP
jgi:hypothetical protein